jgi:hypothetical protein
MTHFSLSSTLSHSNNTHIQKIFFILGILMFVVHFVKCQTPTYQDCFGAIPVCSDSITISFNHNGMGNYTNETSNVSTCYAPE